MTNPEELRAAIERLDHERQNMGRDEELLLATETVINAAQQYLSILPLVSEMVKDKEELFDAANFKHGDDLAKFYTSEALLIQYAEASANNTTAIAKILGGMMNNITTLDDHRPHVIIWCVCLGCKADWFAVIPLEHDDIECKCGSYEVKGIQITEELLTYKPLYERTKP